MDLYKNKHDFTDKRIHKIETIFLVFKSKFNSYKTVLRAV